VWDAGGEELRTRCACTTDQQALALVAIMAAWLHLHVPDEVWSGVECEGVRSAMGGPAGISGHGARGAARLRLLVSDKVWSGVGWERGGEECHGRCTDKVGVELGSAGEDGNSQSFPAEAPRILLRRRRRGADEENTNPKARA